MEVLIIEKVIDIGGKINFKDENKISVFGPIGPLP